MATVPPVADFDVLLKPISGENPAGRNLRFEIVEPKKGIYWHDKIREAHRENLYEQVPKLPDWPTVIDLCVQALTSHTKDLQIAAWLSDAFVRCEKYDRLAGLRDGLKLMRGLIEQYWDQVFPEIDPEGDDGQFTARANIISAFDFNLAFALRRIPLTASLTGLKYSYFDWEDSKKFDVPDKDKIETLGSTELEKVNALKEQAAQENKITSEDWRKAVNTTSYQVFKVRLELLNQCSEELTALDETMDARFQREARGLRDLQKSLEDVSSLARNLERETRPPEVAASMAAPSDGPAGPPTGTRFSGFSSAPGSVQTREDALRCLAEVAEYFRQTEPHSPVSYLVQRAIKWGNMPLENWLEDVVKDTGVLGQLRETLGIKSDYDGGGE